MTLHEACDLALEIQANHPTLQVITIGHFVPFDDAPPANLPWKLSVIVKGYAKPRVIASRDELQQYLPKPEVKPAPKANLAQTPEQMLF